MSETTDPLSPSDRTRIRRGANRAITERERLHELLATAPVAHVGVVAGSAGGSAGGSTGDSTAGHPVVLPVAFAVDVDGPDRDGTLYIHGSVAARWLADSPQRTVCVTVTELDGLVLARSGFHHSVNYRSAVVIGEARLVDDPDEKAHALRLTVDHLVPGRSATLREPTRKELAATSVLAVPLHEASLKVRAGDPVDEPADVEAGVWAGVLPLHRATPGVRSAADSHDDVPPDVEAVAGPLGFGA